jgi:hypothetical protein
MDMMFSSSAAESSPALHPSYVSHLTRMASFSFSQARICRKDEHSAHPSDLVMTAAPEVLLLLNGQTLGQTFSALCPKLDFCHTKNWACGELRFKVNIY